MLPIPRKRRTRAHIIADMRVNHVERFILVQGHTAQRVQFDYGYDLTITTHDEHGYVEPGRILFQVKAAEQLRLTADGQHYPYDIAVEDYNLWINESNPVFLILYDAGKDRAFWLYIQQFFQRHPVRKPRASAKFIRILIPKTQRFNRRMIAYTRRCKDNMRKQQAGDIDHG
ncbi:MAG: DUF4365 domain-containing protein [Gemmataceae bacterium]